MDQIPYNFLGLEPPRCGYDKAKYVVLPIPYDATTSYRPGTRNGPSAIIDASRQVELFDEELGCDVSGCGIATLAPVAPNAAGPAQMHENLFTHAKRIIRDGKFLIGLGGEHSVTSALVRAAAGRHKKLSILQIDAHCDLRDSYEGSPYSHASVMRRSLDHAASLVSVGIRNISEEESRFLKRATKSAKGEAAPRVTLITARETFESEDWVDRALSALHDPVYVTIDVDGFDPAFAPGTGTPEPGGMDWYQVTSLLRLVAEEKCIIGADVVETLPIPGQNATEFLAARLVYKLIGYIETARVGD